MGTPKIRKPETRHYPRGSRVGTTMAQRNASRRNIKVARLNKQARKLQ